MATHTVLISARRIGAIGVQSLGLRYEIEADSYPHAVHEALAQAQAAHGATHENFTPETGRPTLQIQWVNGRECVRALSPTSWQTHRVESPKGD